MSFQSFGGFWSSQKLPLIPWWEGEPGVNRILTQSGNYPCQNSLDPRLGDRQVSIDNAAVNEGRIWISMNYPSREAGPVFDYRNLDDLINWLHQHRLVPSFELMGNPSNHFYDFGAQAEDWHLLIKQILSRYMGRYSFRVEFTLMHFFTMNFIYVFRVF